MKKNVYSIDPVWWWLAAAFLLLIVLGLIIWTILSSAGNNQSYNTDNATVTPTATYFDGAPIPKKTSESNLTLHINKDSYIADTVTISNGMKVVWVNDDGEVHTVTSDDGAFDSGDIASGANFSLVFSEVKNYNYHCKYHTNEHSIISVK